MFDIGFSEIIVILVVALVVVGPERLPTVARTIGALLGRLNRYVSDVKADVQREMRLEEMKKLQTEIEQQAMSIERTVVQEMESAQSALKAPVESVQESLTDVMRETGNALEGVADMHADAPASQPQVATDATSALESPAPAALASAASAAGDTGRAANPDTAQAAPDTPKAAA
jgi:sec-independent protein translocase protein TatB